MIDKFCNTIIDASAGTGKTHTICEMIISRLKAGYDIKEFLIMTFTDKAAGELVERIRKRIKQELSEKLSEKERVNLKNALDSFDYATISTIHGFCKKVLSEYAFECKLPYTLNIDNSNNWLKYGYAKETFSNWINNIHILNSMEVEKVFNKGNNSIEYVLENIAKEFDIKCDFLLPENYSYEFVVPKDIEIFCEWFFGLQFNDIKSELEKNKTKSRHAEIKKYAKILIEKIKAIFINYNDFYNFYFIK